MPLSPWNRRSRSPQVRKLNDIHCLNANELDLSGAWQIAFDPEEAGDRHGWTNGHWAEARSESVQVPAVWNIAFPDAEGIGFYRKVFDLPGGWDGKAVQLHFEGKLPG